MEDKIWLTIPDDSVLSSQDGWTKMSGDRYAALRWHLLISPRKDTAAQTSPSFYQFKVPTGQTAQYTGKKISILDNTEAIKDSLEKAFTTKWSKEISAHLSGSALKMTDADLSSRLRDEVENRNVSDILGVLQNDLTKQSSYDVQDAAEVMSSLSLSPGENAPASTLYFYLKLKTCRWNVYVHRVEYLQLKYKPGFLGFWQDRSLISGGDPELKRALVQVVYYEPDDVPQVQADSFKPEVASISMDTAPVPPGEYPSASAEKLSTLEELARLAFPLSSEAQTKAAKGKAAASKKSGASAGASTGGGNKRGGAAGGSKSGASKGGSKGGAKGSAGSGSKSLPGSPISRFGSARGGSKSGASKGGSKGGSRSGGSKGGAKGSARSASRGGSKGGGGSRKR